MAADNNAVAVILSTTLSLVGIWYLFFYQYVDYRRDLLRARLFSIRAELFDAAADGLIDFDHPAYGQLRRMINGFLRFGHRVGTLSLLGCALMVESRGASTLDFESRWKQATASLDPEVRAKLEDFRKQVVWAFLRHLLFTSAFFIVPIAAVCALLKRLLERFGGDRPSWTNRLESAAFASAESAIR